VEAERAFGMDVAQQLRERLASLREATNVSELLTGHPREILGGRRRCYELDLPENYRMVVCANHKPIPLLQETTRVDWSKVSRVMIHNIEKIEVVHG
jgi:hypothetical protein